MTELHSQLSRRESQIMDVIFEMGEATASDVLQHLPDPPSYSAVRALLTILEDKGHLLHRREGNRYIYRPTAAPERVRRSALAHLLKTFFGGSAPQVINMLLSTSDLSDKELDELARRIEEAKKEGR
jgi:predicted transcriptional regulator